MYMYVFSVTSYNQLKSLTTWWQIDNYTQHNDILHVIINKLPETEIKNSIITEQVSIEY